jgi:hypothetical protein
MITQIELRMQYKFETGRYPIRISDDYLKQEYMQWLEPDKPDKFRIRFLQNTGIQPVLYDGKKRQWNRPAFDQQYGIWLEEIQCKLKTALVEIAKI